MILDAKIVYLGNSIYTAICSMKDGTILKTIVDGRFFEDAQKKIVLNWKQYLWKCGKNFERGSLQFSFQQINLSNESMIENKSKKDEQRVWLVSEENGTFKTIKMETPLMTETEAKEYILSKMFK